MTVSLIYAAYQYLINSASVGLNLLLLYCVRSHTPNQMREMRYLLGNVAVADLVLGILQMMTQFTAHSKGNTTIFVVTGVGKYLGFDFAGVLLALYLAFLYYSFMCLPLNFVSRYRIVCSRNHSNNPMSLKTFTKAVLIMVTIAMGIGIMPLIAYLPKEDLLELYMGGNGTKNESYLPPMVGNTLITPSADGNFKLSDHKWQSVAFTALIHFCTTLVTACYLTVIITGYKMLKYLNRQTVQLAQTKRRIATMNKVIILQALVPVLTVVPGFGVFVLSILFQDLNASEYVVFGLMALINALDPIVPLYYIQMYRRAATNLLMCRRLPKHSNRNPTLTAFRQRRSTVRVHRA